MNERPDRNDKTLTGCDIKDCYLISGCLHGDVQLKVTLFDPLGTGGNKVHSDYHIDIDGMTCISYISYINSDGMTRVHKHYRFSINKMLRVTYRCFPQSPILPETLDYQE